MAGAVAADATEATYSAEHNKATLMMMRRCGRRSDRFLVQFLFVVEVEKCSTCPFLSCGSIYTFVLGVNRFLRILSRHVWPFGHH